MEWGYWLGLGGITLAVIAAVVYFGRKLNTAVERHAPELNAPLNITRAGSALFATVVGSWVLGLATRALKPESTLGELLSGPDGVATLLVGSVLVARIAAAVLERLGYPIAERGASSSRRR